MNFNNNHRLALKISLTLCLIAQTLSAASFGLFDYTDNGTSITIVGYPEDAEGVVVIPSSINGKPVVAIGDSAFEDCYFLDSITIPNSVTSIGDSAFASCGLSSINIPNSVTSIGDSSFAFCSSMTSVKIPSGVTSIGEFAFYFWRIFSSSE